MLTCATSPCLWKLQCFFPAEGEKAAEEKEKDKEAPAATEAADVKDKSEAADMKKGASLYLIRCCHKHMSPTFVLNHTSALLTEEVKGEKDAGKEVKAAREDAPKGYGKPLAERPRFMFNIADGGFTGQY